MAIPASATPITAVVDSRVSPTYGATSRVARVSTTRIAAPLTSTTIRANMLPILLDRQLRRRGGLAP